MSTGNSVLLLKSVISIGYIPNMDENWTKMDKPWSQVIMDLNWTNYTQSAVQIYMLFMLTV